MDELTKEATPRMGVAMHAACTLLGAAFLSLTGYIAYEIFVHFSWALFSGALFSFFLGAEFLRGAFTHRLPGWVAVFLWME